MGWLVRASLVVLVACRAATAPPPPAPPPPRPPVLVSPGPLAQAHAALDAATTCTSCHLADGRVVAAKCLDCHRDLRDRTSVGKGFHASVVVRGKPCEACHRDHRGRAADTLGWSSIQGGRDGFDHDLTGWPLDGAHRARPCSDCHAQRFAGTDRTCGSCHPSQPHGFSRRDMQACERCHTTAAWQPPRAQLAFNHDDRKDARMPLFGAHGRVACRACHANARFNLGVAEPDRCETCHQGPHAGTVMSKGRCEWCHSPTFRTFAGVNFDHTEKTRFDLGGHKVLACARCHVPKLGMANPPSACEACHAARSPHGKRFPGIGCASCHTPQFTAMPAPKWRVHTFTHAKADMRGEHAELTCRACHRGTGPKDFERVSTGCTSCHAHTNVHDHRFTDQQCTNCHWRPM